LHCSNCSARTLRDNVRVTRDQGEDAAQRRDALGRDLASI
jgi:hypothetical protein